MSLQTITQLHWLESRYIGRKLIAKRIGYAPEADVNALLPYLNHQPHSFADWVKSADWSGVFK